MRGAPLVRDVAIDCTVEDAAILLVLTIDANKDLEPSRIEILRKAARELALELMRAGIMAPARIEWLFGGAPNLILRAGGFEVPEPGAPS